MKEYSSPVRSAPSMTKRPPSQSTSTIETFRASIIRGISSTMVVTALTAASRSSSLAFLNFVFS